MATTDARPERRDEDGAMSEPKANGQTSAATSGAPTVTPAPASASAAPAQPPLSRGQAILRYIRNPYPELPPTPKGWVTRAAFGLTIVAAIAYVVFFSAYLFAQQDAYQTHGEDLGIMDQALWTTTHGAILHQTICNIVSDTNCLGDISRFSIHFEPIMLPLAALYYFLPNPKTLQLLQALVVAAGALPAFWLASRRLQSGVAGLGFALIYLLFPALQAAVTDDFHAVTLSAAFLMFAFYFMLARNNVGLFIACILALSTKEEMPLDIIMIGLSVALLQRRWKVGGWLIAISIVWLIVAYASMSLASPTGHPALASRYADFEHHPIQVIKSNVFSHEGVAYLRALLGPVGYLPILSPLTLAIAAPTLAINLLSSDPTMRTGIYQYNAEIVPTLVFATIESVALLTIVGTWVINNALNDLAGARRFSAAQIARLRALPYPRIVLLALTLIALAFGVFEQRSHGYLPITTGFTWPQTTTHAQEANRIITQIPQSASVSAQSNLIPHISERRYIYQFPYRAYQSDYVFLDVTGDQYPLEFQPETYVADVQALLTSGQFHVVVARDGYLLLKRGPGANLNPSDPYGLPASFYSFARATDTPGQPLAVLYGSSLELVGDTVTTSTNQGAAYLSVATYWRLIAPLTAPAHPELIFTSQDGTRYVDRDFAATAWQPMTRWQVGPTYVVRTPPISIGTIVTGPYTLGARVAVGSSPTDDQQYILAKPITGAPGAHAPQLLDGGSVAAFYAG